MRKPACAALAGVRRMHAASARAELLNRLAIRPHRASQLAESSIRVPVVQAHEAECRLLLPCFAQVPSFSGEAMLPINCACSENL